MIRVDGFYLYKVGTQLRPLADLEWGHKDAPTTTYGAASTTLYSAEGALEPLLRTSVFQLKTSLATGEKLLAAIRIAKEKARDSKNEDVRMPFREVYDIQEALDEFEAVLNAELALMPTYIVTQKGGYDTAILISDGARCFPAELTQKAPEAIPDLKQATKSLAFELFTAAGFHLHRANEAVLHRYWDAVSNGATRPKSRNMGEFINELDKHDWGSKKANAALRDLKDLDRNPLIHPDYTVENLDAAIAILNSVHGSITKMLTEMPVIAPAQGTPAGGVVS